MSLQQKLIKIHNEIFDEISSIEDETIRKKLYDDLIDKNRIYYTLLNDILDEKEKQEKKWKEKDYIKIDSITVKAKFEDSMIKIQEGNYTEDYNHLFEGYPPEYKKMLNDFILTYASSMKSCFLIIDGKCISNNITSKNIIFGEKIIINTFIVTCDSN